MTTAPVVRLLGAVLLVVTLVVGGASVALGSHYDESQYEPLGKSETRVDTYGGQTDEQRAPGASGVSYWTESILYAIPEDESVYMKRSVTYRPIVSDCGPGDIEVLGVDRDNTDEGERRVDEDVTDSIKSFSEDADARDRYEREYAAAGELTTTDWQPVERFEIEWYDRDDLGASVQLFHGDRFVSAQRDCYSNPDAAGWYRTASIVTVELENGTTFRPDEPTFSHWFWICDCSDREAAVETLGPPPSETDAGTPTPTPSAGSNSTADSETGRSAARTGTGSSGSTAKEPASAGSTGEVESTATPAPPPSRAPGATATPAERWQGHVVRTPTAAQGTGFGPLLAVLAILAIGVLWRRT